jgi:Na+-driven multidrug efflux pump
MAVSSMAAQNVGAQKWDRVKSIARNGVLFNFILTGLLVLVIEVFSSQALGLFLPAGSPALAIAEHVNRIGAWSFMFFGVAMVLGGVVRATGAVVAPLLVLTVALLVVRFPLAELMMPRWQADAIWWSFPISAVVAACLMGLYYKFGGWRSAKMMRTPHGAPQAASAVPPAHAAAKPAE